jgi:hypothetical protein
MMAPRAHGQETPRAGGRAREEGLLQCVPSSARTWDGMAELLRRCKGLPVVGHFITRNEVELSLSVAGTNADAGRGVRATGVSHDSCVAMDPIPPRAAEGPSSNSRASGARRRMRLPLDHAAWPRLGISRASRAA